MFSLLIDRAFSRSASERQAGAERCTRWRAADDEVRRRRARGETLLGIARDMGLARVTVRRYVDLDLLRTAFALKRGVPTWTG